MRKHILFTCSALFVSFASLQAFAQDAVTSMPDLKTITVNEAIRYAIDTNPDLKSFSRNIDIAEENIDLARAGYRPSVNLTGDITHVRADTDLTDEWGSDTEKSVGLNLAQPLYRGGQTVADVKTRESLKNVAEEQMGTRVQNMVIDVVDAYMATYRTLQAMQVNNDNVAMLEEQLKATVARFKAGELTRTDTSQAEARLAEAQAELAQSRAYYKVALAGLEEVTGLTQVDDLRYPEVEEAVLPMNLDDALRLGIANHPEIQAAIENIQARAHNVEQQKGAFLPQLSANAGVSYERDPSFSQYDRMETASVSLNATIPLYQAGVLRNSLRQSKIMQLQARDDFEAAKRSVTNSIIAAWEEYNTIATQMAARQAQLEASHIAYEGVRLEEEAGARSILDVLDANQDVRDTELALIDVRCDKVNAYYRLLAAIGLLSESFWDNS